jgi:hypothetical protein
MARQSGWGIFLALLIGLGGASLFWLQGPYLKDEVARQVAQALKEQPVTVEVGKAGPELKATAPVAAGSRYQLMSDGKQVFLADLQQGRIWRYFKHTKEGGFAKEEEGFMPLGLFFGGKKYYGAAEVEAPPAKAGENSPAGAKPGGKAAP